MAKADNKKFGEEHWASKLTADDVRNIRLRAARGENQADLARDFNTTRANISMIVAKKRWAKVF